MRIVLSVSFLCFATAAYADGLRAKDIIGITSGMTVDQVQEHITAYNPDMVIQRVSTPATDTLPSYTQVVQGAIPGKNDGDAPQDEVSVRFSRHADGSVLSSAVSHLVYPLPESHRVLFKDFVEKLVLKYGPVSNMNDVGSNEVRWVFDSVGSQKLRTLDSDLADYERCSGAIATISNSTTRAGLPEDAVPKCGDFLYVKLFPLDANHPNVLAGYYMTYIHQDKYLRDLKGDTKSGKKPQNTGGYKPLEAIPTENKAVPKF